MFGGFSAVKTKQNTSHAVMAQRTEGKQSLDDFPTPLWATRALIEHVIGRDTVGGQTCLEPACGRGHMAIALGEYFSEVKAQDIFDYGYGNVADFQRAKHPDNSFDWVITNPPFRLADAARRKLDALRTVAPLVKAIQGVLRQAHQGGSLRFR
jgi:predicted RNA methylase